MPAYTYVAKDATGQVISGTIDAADDRTVASRLMEMGYYVTSISKGSGEKGMKMNINIKLPGKRKVGLKDLVLFCRQFSTMINAGVSLVRCLNILQEQTSNAGLKQILSSVQQEIEGGSTLSASLAKYPKVFSGLFVGLIRAGEVGGVLDTTLDRLAGFLEKDLELRRKIKGAMTYPALVMSVAVIIVFFLITFIVPKFMEMFKDMEIQMPAMTMMLMQLGDFSKKYWYALPILGGGGFFAFKQYTNTASGRRQWDWVRLKFPVFGPLNQKVAMARFSRTLNTLLVSGVPILQAMETVAGTLGNEIISKAVTDARISIREGESISTPLAESKLFPPMVVQMIIVGEETGALDELLAKIADFYDDEVSVAVEGLTAALEPLMIVFLGSVVGFIVIAMMMPMVSLISGLSGGGDGGG
ncbi:MAG: type II secretion system F family protein [bacterium]|nr:type II secretion system F family protein [bacterium]